MPERGAPSPDCLPMDNDLLRGILQHRRQHQQNQHHHHHHFQQQHQLLPPPASLSTTPPNHAPSTSATPGQSAQHADFSAFSSKVLAWKTEPVPHGQHAGYPQNLTTAHALHHAPFPTMETLKSSIPSSRPQKRKQCAPMQRADGSPLEKKAASRHSIQAPPTLDAQAPPSDHYAPPTDHQINQKLAQFVNLLHGELEGAVQRAFRKSSSLPTSIVNNNNNNNNSSALNANLTCPKSVTSQDRFPLNAIDQNHTGALEEEPEDPTPLSARVPELPSCNPRFSQQQQQQQQRMTLLALQHAATRMSGGQLTSSVGRQNEGKNEPEQTEAMSLVVSTPKKRRTKVCFV